MINASLEQRPPPETTYWMPSRNGLGNSENAIVAQPARPAFMVDAGAKITFKNKAAVTLLNDSWLYVTNRTLYFAEAELDSAFRRLLSCYAMGTLKSESVATADHNATIQIRPCQSTEYSISSPAKHEQYYLVYPVKREANNHRSYLAGQFALTRAETDIGLKLLQGKCLQQIAKERRVSVHTLRSQVKAILAKTNCRTQHQFVARTFRALAPA